MSDPRAKRRALGLALSGLVDRALRDAVANEAIEPSPERLEDALRLLEELGERGILLHLIGDEGYPRRFSDLKDPPALIFVAGRIPPGGQASLGVVGMRDVDDYGRRATEAVALAGLRAGRLIISGGALGVDTVAHETALAQGMPTVVVLGSGFDKPYPKANAPLFARVVAGGAVISEFLPGVAGNKWTFPKRNRLVAALSDDLVVTRSLTRSGALITARQALGLDRPVWAVPGDVFDPRSAGPLTLLEKGARPITSLEAFTAALGGARQAMKAPAPSIPAILEGDREGLALWRALEKGPIAPDDLVAETSLSARVIARLSATLEVEGLVSRDGAGRISRRPA